MKPFVKPAGETGPGDPSMGGPGGYMIPPRYWLWLARRRTLVILSWLATLSVAAVWLFHAWHWFDDPPDAPAERRRADGNSGHCQIDFGGQWVMGRMIVLGYGRELYHRQRQWQVVRAGYPVGNEPPYIRDEIVEPPDRRRLAASDEVVRHDAEALMNWFMGADPDEWRLLGGAVAVGLAPGPFLVPVESVAAQLAIETALTPEVVTTLTRPAIGGPLYPPLHGILYAPLGAIADPRLAYRVMQVAAAGMVFLTGLLVSLLSRGRVPWSVATLVLFWFPGTRGALDLGQNPSVSLTIVLAGWVLAARGRPALGGAVWGLLAFKPVWCLAFFLVPLLSRRWKFAAAMVLTAGGLVVATLPVVGLSAWFDWLTVGKEAAALYNVNRNWILLSRDVQGIPRRILHDFDAPESERDTPLARALAWGAWTTILLTTAAVYLRSGDRSRFVGVGPAFLFFGAFLTCYRFMYYDSLLAAAGCAVLFADLSPFLRTRLFAFPPLVSAYPPSRCWPGTDPPFRPTDAASVTGPTDTHQALLTAAGSTRADGSRDGLPPPASAAPATLASRTLGYVSSFPLTMLVLLLVYELFVSGFDFAATFAFGRWARRTTAADGTTGSATPRLEWDTGINYPWETGLVFLIWSWCGLRLMTRGELSDRR